ncbi:hypothetical protein [Bacillus sp. V59.32b]|uniref:hypothetical protein n=1 Tax=Bacillus sp. V59.32b TaxID=1758642 RepID=UPI000E3C9FEE|nr:hypothetical protein [Bacillus sp. V59.32b]RFU60625.1 hypothetical protein D0463_16630 [Bacillus sp. V59.32b]
MGFRTMLFGFIFILFDINLEQFDILSDVIGYILLFIGAATIKNKMDNTYFSLVRKCSQILIILSASEVLIRHFDLLNHGMFIFESTVGMLFGFVYILGFASLLTYCVYNLCMGIEKEAVAIGEKELAFKAKKVFKAFIIYQGIFLFFLLLVEVLGEFIKVGIMAMFIVLLVSAIYICFQVISLLNQSENVFHSIVDNS